MSHLRQGFLGYADPQSLIACRRVSHTPQTPAEMARLVVYPSSTWLRTIVLSYLRYRRIRTLRDLPHRCSAILLAVGPPTSTTDMRRILTSTPASNGAVLP